MKTPARLLNDAADHIEKVGLWKGNFVQPAPSDVTDPGSTQRPVCALGALNFASSGNPYDTASLDCFMSDSTREQAQRRYWAQRNRYEQARRKLAAAVAEENIQSWNDRTDTTQADVVAALRRAARNQ